MQPVRQAEQPVVVLRIVEVEDVLVVDEDLADDGIRGLELRIRGNPGRLGRRNADRERRYGDTLISVYSKL
jgi:hypothetical protein